jgi:hypothetical protein
MLSIYPVQSIGDRLVGGSTHPRTVIINKDNKLVPYAMKLYKEKDIESSFSVAKDVYCSILAKEFGLATPPPALLDIPDSIYSDLSDELKMELSGKDKRLKFGCKLINGAFPYIDSTHREYLNKYDIETIYAFDNLIKNGDRDKLKSNILMKGTVAYLIDHELTLTINETTIQHFIDSNWVYSEKNHIFYAYLKDGKKEDKKTYFEDFENSLNGINFDVLDSYSEQLIKLGHHTEENYFILKEYLCLLQRDSGKFVNLLRGHLS